MLEQHLKAQIIDQLGYIATTSQEEAAARLAHFLFRNKPEDIFILNGYAGTGKTTMINALIKTLSQHKIQSVLMAPTGRAAKVISKYTGHSAYTIHKKIYRQKSSSDGFGKFELNKNLYSNTLFIVDEASMIGNDSYETAFFGSGKLLDDLIEFVYTGNHCRLILIGDEAQLPPVGLDSSPALNLSILENYGLKALNISLEDIIRQSTTSGILMNANRIRAMQTENTSDLLTINYWDFDDVNRISGEELIDEIDQSYRSVGINDTIIVCRSNKRANQYNQGIRNRILFREEEIAAGDLLMVVKNNYFWFEESEEINFIANGDLIEILRIYDYEDLYGFRFANITARFIDYDTEIDLKIILDTLSIESASLSAEQNKELFFAISEDYSEFNKKKRIKKVKEDPYFNALQVKFAYAITCHKAQGGQWKHVYIDQGWLPNDSINTDYYRWLYTAFTRASEKLFLVNFRKDFFGEE